MRYEHFDYKRWEYVITNPSKFLTLDQLLRSENSFHLISKTERKYDFYKDDNIRRNKRNRYNCIQIDDGGRYFYIKDGDNIWNSDWKSCKTPSNKYEFRHCMNYTYNSGVINGVETEVLLFFPISKN